MPKTKKEKRSCINDLVHRLNVIDYYDYLIEYPGEMFDEDIVSMVNLEIEFSELPKADAIELAESILNKIDKVKSKGEGQFIHCEVIDEEGNTINDRNSQEYLLAYKTHYREIIEELNYYARNVVNFLDSTKYSIPISTNRIEIGKGDVEYLKKLPKRVNHHLGKGVLLPQNLALLIDYLKKLEVFLDHDDLPLAKHLHYLTGHSAQKIRTYLSPKMIAILKDEGFRKERKGKENNLKLLKKIIDSLQNDINRDIEIRNK